MTTEFMVSFHVSTRSKSLKELNELLGYQHALGVDMNSPQKYHPEREYKQTSWWINSPLERSASLEEQMEAVARLLPPGARNHLLEPTWEKEVYIGIGVLWELNETFLEFDLPKSAWKFFEDLPAPIRISVYPTRQEETLSNDGPTGG
jgi:hypothetical protein